MGVDSVCQPSLLGVMTLPRGAKCAWERQLEDGEVCLLFTLFPLAIHIGCDFPSNVFVVVHQLVCALSQPSFDILDAGVSLATVDHAKPDMDAVRLTSLRFFYGQGQIRRPRGCLFGVFML